MLNFFCSQTSSFFKNPLPISSPKWMTSFSHAQAHLSPISSWVPPVHSRKQSRKRALEASIGLEAQIEPEEVDLHISEGKLLSELSTWGIGGPAKYFVEVNSETHLLSAFRYCQKHNLRFFILGRGSNCLFDDRGFDGCIILNQIDFVEKIFPATYRVGSGYAFNQLGLQCSKDGLTGLEFGTGIPGTVGGAVYMNAGAGGQETADVLKSVEIIMVDGRRKTFRRSELIFSYRKSPFQHMQNFVAIVSATFELASLSSSRERQKLYLERRNKTQPIGERSAGCVFRNPTTTSLSAGAVIEQAGLKGVMVGGAKVSEMHANFFINVGNSTSADMCSLINIVKEQVRQKLGVDLQEEILYVPYN
ncbi:uncharacterized protein LOC131035390 isoform X2 [Cryptomeria japonica]|uniref:uncharacterized protein LOC131035390 isoform X2 n=1 Tax=Cryptomeria japonica TaxID=3369 RepID=UPI0027D9DB9A|nr:uncharacterized protein LOC131035390 isoform X2 [Cryptomeria japonica]